MDFNLQGATASQLEKDIGHEFPQNEHYFGLVNVSMLVLSLVLWKQKAY